MWTPYKRIRYLRLIFVVWSLALMTLPLGSSVRAQESEPHGTSVTQAPVNTAFSYQGRLLDPNNGRPVADATYSMIFRLYTVSSGGTALQTLGPFNVTTQDGLFSVLLAFNATLFDGQALFLETQVGDETLSPRLPLTVAPYALWAQTAALAHSVRAGGITEGMVADGAITGPKLADGAVAGPKIADGGVSRPKLVDGAVSTSKLADAAVSAAKLADNAVTAPKLVDGAVSTSKLVNNAVTGAKLADGTVSGPKLVDGAVAASKLADGAVGPAKLADNAVTAPKVANGAISGPKLLDGAITGAKLADGSINGPKLIDGSVTSAKIADGSVSGPKLTANSVDSAKIADGSVSAADINSTQVQRRVTGTCPPGSAIRGVSDTGTVTCEIVDGGSASGWTLSGNSLYATSTASNVGIGTTNPTAKVEVAGGHVAINDNMLRLRTGADANHGLLFSAVIDGPEFRGFSGFRWTTGSNGATERMRLNSAGNLGLGTSSPSARLHIVGASTGDGIDVSASEQTKSAVFAHHDGNLNGYGVYGRTGTGVGVYGASLGPGGTIGPPAGTGVIGEATGVNGIGVRGRGGTNGYGVYADGNAHVSGTLTKGGGAFKIDHPLDPTNKYLYHSFVESPDMLNIYNGNVKLDANGEAWVELPAWFDALNRDFRYQLTTIGGYAPVYIAEEIAGNRFKIGGGKPGLKVSWQVTGVRQDAYAEQHRIPVEVDKPDGERGKYLHPQVYGQPESLGIDAATRSAAGVDGTAEVGDADR